MSGNDTSVQDAAAGLAGLQRRLTLYLIALWGRPFSLVAGTQSLPAIRADAIELPAVWSGEDPLLRYRAAAVHAAAHQVYGAAPFIAKALKGRQRALVGLMEDARVESLAMRDFPGLRRIWSAFHQATAADGNGFDALLARLAHSIMEPRYQDTNAWVRKGVELYRAQVHECPDAQSAHAVGMRLANDIGQLRIPMNEAEPPCVAAYHDDNLHLWLQEHALAANTAAEPAPVSAASRMAHLIERSEGKRMPFSAERPEQDAPPGWSIHTTDDQAALEFAVSTASLAPVQYRYPEWDYRIGLVRQSWTTLHLRAVPSVRTGLAENLLLRHAHHLATLERIVSALRQQGRVRLRRQYEGEDVDLDSAIGAAVELRSRHAPELRVYARQQLHSRQDVTVLLLLDLSESANDRIAGSQCSVLELTRDASLLLAVVLERLGERFAVHGFNSNGRHEVGYVCFKDFTDRCDSVVQDRIAGMRAGLSTRLGAALRHAGSVLADQPGERKLLLVITDGQPSDIDVYDTRYLSEDARDAVQTLRSGGVQSFCLSLDPRGDAYAARIFGPAHYEVLEHIDRLPEKLPRLVLTLTRRH